MDELAQCGHKLYKAGHCANMICLNYVFKCPYCNPASSKYLGI
jgi:hypothetical protein